jgi:2-C-methyl-D-erythritol 2,4-cyclodiphosphate synthase
MKPDLGKTKRPLNNRKSAGKGLLATPDARDSVALSDLPPSAVPWRVGIGNDLHRLADGRKLILGGVHVPFGKGPVGHSDGDVLAHAICDALLGAAGLGDIGRHFPNASPQWKDAPSLVFLRSVRQLLDDARYTIVNVDATVGLERPKLAPHIRSMERNVAAALALKPAQVSVKAKTGEGLDAVGRGEAIRADAVTLIQARHGTAGR